MLNVPMFSLFPIAASLSVSVDETGILMGSPDSFRQTRYLDMIMIKLIINIIY